MSGISAFGSFSAMRMNPDDYAQKYAEQNNISVDDAKAELKAKHGDPSQDNTNLFQSDNSNESDFYGMDFSDADLASVSGGFDISNLLKQFMDLFTGNQSSESNSDGPQKEGDPQPHLVAANNNEVDSTSQQLPEDGDNNLDFASINIPDFTNMDFSSSDSSNPFAQGGMDQDPDKFAQQYANDNGLSVEEAMKELKSKYGDPEQK